MAEVKNKSEGPRFNSRAFVCDSEVERQVFRVAVTTWRLLYSCVTGLKSPPQVITVSISLGEDVTTDTQSPVVALTGLLSTMVYLYVTPLTRTSISSPLFSLPRSQRTDW